MATYTTEPSDTASVSIPAPPELVWRTLADVVVWPHFSPFVRSAQPATDAPGRYRIRTPSGSVELQTHFDAERFLLDHEVHFPDGSSVFIPYRVVGNSTGSELIMTNVKAPGDSLEAYEEQVRWMYEELLGARRWVLHQLPPVPSQARGTIATDSPARRVRACVSVLLARWRSPAAPARVRVEVGTDHAIVCHEHDSVDLWSADLPRDRTEKYRASAHPIGPDDVHRTDDISCGQDCGAVTLVVRADPDLAAIEVAPAPGITTAHEVTAGWATALETLLNADASEPWALRSTMSGPQRAYLLNQLNDYRSPETTDQTLAAPFERQARLDPNRVALVSESGHTISYGEFDQRAESLARRLSVQGCRSGGRVGIALPRSVEQLTAIYAVAKCGATYVPLDVEQSTGRLGLILDDSRPEVIVTDAASAAQIPSGPWPLCLIEGSDGSVDEASEADEVRTDRAAATDASVASVAHLLYTSGTTGRPKGVMTSVASALANIAWMQHRYPYAPGDTAVFKTSFGFDVSIWEIFWPLYHGARLLVTETDTARDPGRLAELLAHFQVAQLFVVPSVMGPLVDQMGTVAPTRLRFLISGGETLPTHLRDRFYAKLPGATLINAYGPCEAGSVTDAIAPPTRDPGPVPVGTPAPNFRVCILDTALQPTPLGVPGETYIGGEIGIGYGYWDNPRATAERFIADPWGLPGSRLYRSGDLCHLAEDGRLVHLGRIDRQLKVRGMRLEPAEVESVLAAQPSVRECAVLVDSFDNRLVAWVVASDPSTVATEPEAHAAGALLRRDVADLLPRHGVPDEVVWVSSLPTTVNGKLDAAALFDARRSSGGEPVAAGASPSGPESTADLSPTDRASIEQILIRIYCEVLHRETITTDDTFIDLGGHSLLAFELLDRCQAQLAVKPEVALLLTRSIADVARYIWTHRPLAAAATTTTGE